MTKKERDAETQLALIQKDIHYIKMNIDDLGKWIKEQTITIAKNQEKQDILHTEHLLLKQRVNALTKILGSIGVGLLALIFDAIKRYFF